MSATAIQGQAERAELEEVLNSRIFNRAPSLVSFLKYVCQCHFDGNSDDLKEYSIAVEALGRPPDFDQKKDSIVRVEAHRLRKRLADYYQTEGAHHTIQIEIPNGQYAPQFIYRDIGQPEPPVEMVPLPEPELIEPAVEPVVTLPEVARPRSYWLAWLSLGAICVTGVVLWTFHARFADTPDEIWHGSAAGPVPSEFRMLAGYHGEPFMDRQGRNWQPDAYYKGGKSVALPADFSFEGLPDPNFARSSREGNFEYSIPERAGTYEVHLYFAARQSPNPDSTPIQMFQILINGKVALNNFDVLADSGSPNRLTSRVVRDVTPGTDGRIHLRFLRLTDRPVLSALEILWSDPGTVRPVRIVAAKQSVTDPKGAIWMAEEYAVGGKLVERNSSIQDADLRPLFAGEHYGNFAYRIPVPPGKYRVRLFFAETYFGSKLPWASTTGNIGARLFNVFCDGGTLLRNFDITQEAGGPNRAVVRTFDNLEPNAQGKIVLEFEPVRNFAEVNAIEVTQMPAQ